MRQQGTILDAVGRTKHSLQEARGGEAASVTVHGECPVADCHEMILVPVSTATASVACPGCGTVFDV